MILDYSSFRRLHESVTINGRLLSVAPNGTIIVPNSNGENKQVRFSAMGQKFNLVSIELVKDGYRVCAKSGRCETISLDQVKDLISFVDRGSPTVIDSGSAFKPNVQLKLEG